MFIEGCIHTHQSQQHFYAMHNKISPSSYNIMQHTANIAYMSFNRHSSKNVLQYERRKKPKEGQCKENVLHFSLLWEDASLL